MKVVFDENVFDEIDHFHPNFDESVPNRSNTKKTQFISIYGKVIPHLGGIGKNLGGILLMSITTKTDPALIDQGNLLKGDWDIYSRYDSQNSLGASLQFKIR